MAQRRDSLRLLHQGLIGTFVLVLVLTSFPWPVEGQIYVHPRRPTQSNVRYFDFDWQYVDIMVGSEADPDDAEGVDFHTPVQALLEGLGSQSRLSHQHRGHHRHGPGTLHHDSGYFGPGHPTYFGGSPFSQAFPDPAEDTRTEPPEPRFPPPDEENDLEELEEREEQEEVDEAEEQDDERSGDADEEAKVEEQIDPLEGLSLEKSGGVRLYFYERERDVAERAAAFIEESYLYLVGQFRYVPTRTLPYVLYNSYQEFLQTNIFPVQEGVLGVTGRRDLKLVLPYFGDHRLFQHISTHEMVHQFTIQKARDVADAAGVIGDPLDRMPLWFIEGIAEYYALRGMDPETEMLTRDLLLNPDPQRGYVMLDFFEDRPFSGLWTYKVGQARVAFLEEVYGEGTIQKVMDQSYRLVGRRETEESRTITFRRLLVDITGDDAQRISARFERWIKERSFSRFLESDQHSSDLVFVNNTRGMLQHMTSSPDGYLLMYRSIQAETGRVRLFVMDSRDSGRSRLVATDGAPGVESLHPVGPRNFDIRNEKVVYTARSEGKDLLYIQQLRHSAERDDDGEWEIRLRTGRERSYDLSEAGIVAAELPTFSPDGERIAFIGLNGDGQKDVYIFEPGERSDFRIFPITEDERAQRGLTWGDEGLIFGSDATSHGYYNLFRASLPGGLDENRKPELERLTFEARDHFDPRIMPDGRLFFTAYSASRANIYEIQGPDLVRRTDIVTGLFGIAPGPGSAYWATFHHRGQKRPVRITADRLLDRPVATTGEGQGPEPIATRSLDDSQPYRATEVRNWQLSNAFGVLGASSAGVYGQLAVLTNDRLRNHALFLNVFAFGDLNNTIADLLYLNQERRLIWGAGLFQDVRYRIDRTAGPENRFLSGERFYGARTSLRYPLSRFFYVQGDLALGGVGFFVQDRTREILPAEVIADWDQLHDRHRFQASPSASLGFNTIRYHPGTGPISGTSALLETTLDVQPFDDEVHGTVRLDAERYFPIFNRINLGLRGATGTTYGGELRRQFYLSSFDTLRGVELNDQNYLLGDVFFFSKAELRFPLNFLLRVPLIDIEGLVAIDFGGAGVDFLDLWESRALAPVTGFNFGLGPIVFRLHFAKPLDIGSKHPVPRDGDWITNFSVGWRYW